MSKSDKLSDNNKLNKLFTTYLENRNKLAKNEYGELEIKFGTRGIKPITKIKFDNVIQKLLSQNFKFKEESVYYLNINTDTIRTSITGLKNIQDYCRTNNIPVNPEPDVYKFIEKKGHTSKDGSPSFVNFDDFNFRASYSIETTYLPESELITDLLKKWVDAPKFYRLINRYTMVHADYPVVVDLSVVRESPKGQNNLKESKMFGFNPKYEIEIELNNELIDGNATSKMLDQMLKKITLIILGGLQGTNYPVSYLEQSAIADEYKKLVKGDKYHDKYHDKTTHLETRDFIGPSSITLQTTNIAPHNTDSNIVNIRNDYTVTDKADGDRKMLYVANSGKIYLITTLMEIEFTGAKTNNGILFNSLLDGEHIKHNKHGDFINLYAAFDIYFINKKDVRKLPFTMQTTDQVATNFRLPLLGNFITELNAVSINNASVSPIYILKKTFYQTREAQTIVEAQTIFQACKKLQDNILEGLYPYETDGFIFTPSNLGVGINKPGAQPPNTKITWQHSLKWKPAKYNTIDFLCTTKKLPSGLEYTGDVFESGVNTQAIDSSIQYKTLVLRVGYNSTVHGFSSDPCENVYRDEMPEFVNIEYNKKYSKDLKPAQFVPSNPYDADAGITNIRLKSDNTNADTNADTNTKQMYTENDEIIEDNTIVEFRYDKTAPKHWRWIPLRVRYDKTAEYRMGLQNYGNAYHVAQSNWYSIHNPVTLEMLTTGANIRTEVADSDIYYNNKGGVSYTTELRNFHNLYVKNKLISSVASPGDTLIDYAVGKAGDISKWIAAHLSFIFGIDISKDNIQNKSDGACARYLNIHKSNNSVPSAMFLHGNSSLNIRDTSAFYSEKSKLIAKAIFGEGSKEQESMSILGNGVLKSFGKGAAGFNISSIQFAIHYMFENENTLDNFLTNVTECTKVDGYFIGTCYDGKEIFKLLRDKESLSFMDREKNKLLEITKLYDADKFPDDVNSLGYGINVFQESINQTIKEYLVNYDYLISKLANYGFVPLPIEESKKNGLSSVGNFRDLFKMMEQEIKKNPSIQSEYGLAYMMKKEQKDISFLNKYFIFKKVHNVNIKDVKLGLLQSSEEEQIELMKASLRKEEEEEESEEAQEVVVQEAAKPKNKPVKNSPIKLKLKLQPVEK